MTCTHCIHFKRCLRVGILLGDASFQKAEENCENFETFEELCKKQGVVNMALSLEQIREIAEMNGAKVTFAENGDGGFVDTLNGKWSMKNKLIELLEDTLIDWECDVNDKTISEIAEHLIDNGVIVPPCQVGQTIYRIGDNREIYDYWDIVKMEVYFDGIGFVDDSGNWFTFEDICKTVFLTVEDAKQKLGSV